MADDLEKLLKKADEQEAVELKIFQNAIIKNLKAYQQEPTRNNKINLDAAREALQQKKEELTEKYFSSVGESSSEENQPCFDSLLSVCAHLQTCGYRISKSKLYRDRDKNLIKVNKNGTVPESEVRVYASTLDRNDPDIGDLNDIFAKKAAIEVKVREEQYKKLKFARLREQGKYLPRRLFEAELASRAVVLESGFRQSFRMNAGKWVALVNGRREKIPELLEELIKDLEAQLTSYATMDTFLVMFQESDTPEDFNQQ